MSEAYSKPCEMHKMIRYIENPGVVSIIYSGIFKHIHRDWEIFSQSQIYWKTLRDIQAYSGIIQAYWALFRHIQNCLWLLHYLWLCRIQNPGTLPKASSKTCQTYMIRSSILRVLPWSKQFLQVFSRIFRFIQGYWFIFSHTHKHATRRECEGGFHWPNLKNVKSTWIIRKKPWLFLSLT